MKPIPIEVHPEDAPAFPYLGYAEVQDNEVLIRIPFSEADASEALEEILEHGFRVFREGVTPNLSHRPDTVSRMRIPEGVDLLAAEKRSIERQKEDEEG